jgi:hypothetical protein
MPCSVSCPSGWGGGLKIHCRQLRVGSNPTADICSQRACVSVSWWNNEFYWMALPPCSLCFILHFSFHGICQVHVALVVRVALSLLPSSAVSFFQPSGQLPLLFSRYAWSRLRSLVMKIWRQLHIFALACNWAHGVGVSHPPSMREALGSIPSVSIYWFLQ